MEPFIRGVGVALVTPFDLNGNIDFTALEHLVNYVTEGGVDYLVALGTTAETPTLSPQERDMVIDHIRKVNAEKLPLIVGIGGNNTAAVIASISKCDLSGVSAVLSVTPFYNKPTQRGLYEHYKAIAAKSPLPIILYNVPSRTGVNMLPETTLRLAHGFNKLVAINGACGDL